MALACAADLRLAAESAFFTSAFLRVGTTADMGLPWHLVRLVGIGKAKELCLLGERIDAKEAVRIGLASRVVADWDLRRLASDIAARLAGFAPLATAGSKKGNDAAIVDFATFLDVESDRFGENAVTADATEAVQAFIVKRSPQF